jgi:hypothetical protein
MDEARRWLYQTIIGRLQHATGAEYTVVLSRHARPRTVTKPLDDGSRLEVELAWGRDAPQVVWAARIFPINGEELTFPLPLDLIRLAVAKDAPPPDAAAGA